MTTPNPAIKGPGILFVQSAISRPDIMDYDTYMKWYDEDHIDEIIHTDAIKSAFRYINTSPDAKKPYLAFYPMEDIAFTQGERFRKIRVHSDLLPGSGLCYDLADIDVRYCGLVRKTEAKSTEPAAYVLVTGIEPGTSQSGSDVEAYVSGEQIEAISKLQGYIRTTRFKLLYARTNAQSRALKGLPTTDEPNPEPPTHLSLHEFERDPSRDELTRALESGNGKKIFSEAKEVETHIYKIAKAHGAKKFFEE
ncbi:hypothetical protein M501DRAFT_940071 [Patellaria atrata CBS 101060]|uniref:Uncharacterized protein n=1 Tax=Patellaria atrata CBS 101060 TaxID=1346257 RepID=A0A9P4S4X7_9PEZI|nr:hypothetical protein M501DRAFT_940071 [Patellaria atrata CBS 101060]